MPQGDDTALEEWKRHWPLVMAALVGISFPAVASYSIGFFIEPLGQEFGWSRTEISFGLTIYAFVVVPLSPVVGAIMDRWGARCMAVLGMILSAAAFASFGLSNGSLLLWTGQWILYSVFALAIKTTVWTAAVSGAFQRARGMAIAVALCGTAIAQTLAPLLSYWLIENYGWRSAYAWLGFGWGGFALLLIVFFFFDGHDRRKAAAKAHTHFTEPSTGGGLSFGEAIRSPDIIRIAAAMMIVSMVGITLIVHKVPLLAEMGISRAVAAQIAATAGVAGITGKLVTGWLYDRFSTRWIGAAVFGLPAIGYGLLLEPVRSQPLIVLSMILLGFCSGAAMQANVYLTSRYGGLRNFGKIFGVMGSVAALATGVGPVIGGWIFDHFGSYTPFLIGSVPLGVLSGVLMLGLANYPDWQNLGAPEGEGASSQRPRIAET